MHAYVPSRAVFVIEMLNIENVLFLITRWEKLLDSDRLRECELIPNLRANSVIRGKLLISRAKCVMQIN